MASAAASGMRKAPSLEWRWVSTEEDDDEDRGGRGGAAAVGAVGRGGSFESEDEEDAEDEEEREGKKRLIRTVPSVDWFDVEGNEVSVGQQVEDTEVRGLARAIIPLSRLGRGTGVCFCCVIEIDLLRGQDDTDKVLIA